VVATLAGASLAVTGLVPASTYAASVHTAPPALLGIALGLILQASNIGHFAGPATLGWWAGAFGWSSAPALFGVVAIAGMLTSLALRKRLHGGERGHVVAVARGD
jgi:dipeptide/tripeptide permease